MERELLQEPTNDRWDKWLAHLAIRYGLLSFKERKESHGKNMLRILAYHRIGYPKRLIGKGDPGLVSATPEQFYQQMELLVEQYYPLSLEELLSAVETNHPLPPRSVLVTFDDGYQDFLDYAWPVLEHFKIPSILFVATDYLSGDSRMFWWDQLCKAIVRTKQFELCIPSLGFWPLKSFEQRMRAYQEVMKLLEVKDHVQMKSTLSEIFYLLDCSSNDRTKEILSWEDIKRLSRSGVYIGAHTQTHPILSRLPLYEARKEIVESQQDLKRELGKAWPIFAYPVGHPAHLRNELVSILEEEGFRLAVTMIEGHNRLPNPQPLKLRRVGMAPHLSMDEFRLVLTSFYNTYSFLLRFWPT